MVKFIRSDLDFILQQILIAEQNAAGVSMLDLLPNVQVPWGLRTVTGSLNNLVVNARVRALAIHRSRLTDAYLPRLHAVENHSSRIRNRASSQISPSIRRIITCRDCCGGGQ